MQVLQLKYYNERLGIGLADWKTAFLLAEGKATPLRLKPELHRWQLVYRVPGSSRRFSYRQVKRHLMKALVRIIIPAPL